MNSPAVTTIGCPDDGSVVAGGSPGVGVGKGHAVESVALRKRILPDPMCARLPRAPAWQV